MTNTPDTDLCFTVAGFYYKTDVHHLALGQAHRAVSDSVRTKVLDLGTMVLVWARYGDKYLAQVGVATGDQHPMGSADIWPEWDNNKLVHSVRWLTDLVPVPSDIIKQKGQNLSHTKVRETILYILTNFS